MNTSDWITAARVALYVSELLTQVSICNMKNIVNYHCRIS